MAAESDASASTRLAGLVGTRGPSVLISILAISLVAEIGCSAGRGESSPTTATTIAAEPVNPAPSWTISPTGLGPFEVGMTVREAEIASGQSLDVGFYEGQPGCFSIEPAGPDGTFLWVEVPVGQADPYLGTISVVGVFSFDAISPSISTDTGLRLGDDLSQVESAYGDSLSYSEMDNPGWFAMVETSDRAIAFVGSEHGPVRLIQAGDVQGVHNLEGCF